MLRVAKLVLAASLVLAVSPALARLQVGARAPTFTIEAALAGRSFQFPLADALAKGPVVLYFYPKSFTSVCTEEAHLFAEAIDEFAANGASVIGISADTIETQRKFSSLECRDKFPVGADPDLKVIKDYDAAFGLGVVNLPLADRVSYVIAPDGTILSSVKDSGAAAHIQKSLEAVKAWRAGATR
ncbi:MAG: peroxiredoxin [Rhodoplanes sp.]|uniref:peroxiredoxin n=1 Tax=Rhodoplanes sp. TaxID=1968906 RepID=UPI001809BBDC|nr:peroxiredoxin [Rhodoplanes sp.]NVO12981.1 peroxiredoxin [Rhodoplanes sp.]